MRKSQENVIKTSTKGKAEHTYLFILKKIIGFKIVRLVFKNFEISEVATQCPTSAMDCETL
jgi:hypothetical protein